jgi:hypothetical protein
MFSLDAKNDDKALAKRRQRQCGGRRGVGKDEISERREVR